MMRFEVIVERTSHQEMIIVAVSRSRRCLCTNRCLGAERTDEFFTLPALPIHSLLVNRHCEHRLQLQDVQASPES